MFKQIRFCLDELSTEEKNSIKRLIEKEDGLCQGCLDEDVSYLVVKKVGSRNFYVAQDLNIHIIPPQWIYDSVSKKNLQNTADYPFQLFEGIIATTTGFDLHERYAMQSEIELHGGVFERELVYDHTNYLIARNIQSEKYKTAVEWDSVIIVNEDWLSDSFSRGKLQNPLHYQNYTQTTTKQDKAASVPQMTSFTDSCLSLIQPLDNSYLTPNKTVARTREVDNLLDGYFFYLSIENTKCFRRIQSILHSHGAYCIDYIMPSTTLIVAETLTDYQNAIQQIHSTEGLASPSSSVSSLTGFDTSVNQDVDLYSIPIVNTNWVLETHSQYCIQSFEEFQWTKGIFSNLSFFIYEFKRDYDHVKRSIEANDGKVVPCKDQATYIVCPRTVDTDIYLDDRAVSAKWLRACLDAKRLVSRSSMVLYRPFPRLLNEKVLCLTGFGYDDRLKMESYVVALGGKLENTVTSSIYALICQEHVKMNVKIQEAQKLRIPRVRRDWIDRLIVHKELVPLEDYLLQNDSVKKEEVEVVELTSKETHPVHSSLFMIDCRSNSMASEGKEDETTSLFGEKKDREVIYTSFNEIFKNKPVSTPSDSQKSLIVEQQIQKESQNILSPRTERPTAEAKSLLQGLPLPNGGSVWGKSLMSKNTKRIRLDDVDTSITVLDDDLEKKEVKRRGRQPKSKAKVTRKSKQKK